MRLTLLGTGAAGGVPLYGCNCPACARAQRDARHLRRPCSALVEAGDTRVLLDAGLMDLHERFPPGSLDSVVLTHFHVDHVQGLFHWRWGVGAPIPVHAPPDSEGCADLYKHPGLLAFRRLRKFEPLHIGALHLTPLPLIHSRVTFGQAIEGPDGARLAYLTDTCGLPPATETFLRDWRPDLLVLDCSAPPGAGGNHNDWSTALAVIEAVAPGRACLTHLGHALDAWLLKEEITPPNGVDIGHDGEVFELMSRSSPTKRSAQWPDIEARVASVARSPGLNSK